MKNSSLFNYLGSYLRISVLLLVFSAFLVSCTKEESIAPQEESAASKDIYATLDQFDEATLAAAMGDTYTKAGYKIPTFRTLTTALVRSGLLPVVVKERITLFAPTDEAFAAIGLNPRNVADTPGLAGILAYHAISGRQFSKDLMSKYYPTLNGAAVKIEVNGGVMVNDANVKYANIRAINGVIHIIDKVLLPPTQNLVELAASIPDFSILVQAVVKAGLADELSAPGPYTVFAPTNDAFVSLLGELGAGSLDDIPVDLLTKVLLYHVVSGRVYSTDLTSGPVTSLGGRFNVDVANLKLTDAQGRMAGLVPSLLNVQATNGVVHVIDKVILPPTKNIVELAQMNPAFSILVQAVVKAGYVDLLSGEGPYTVFAPTNDAFVALLAELGLGSLDDIPVATLQKVLAYHVVSGKVFSDNLVSGPVSTLAGSSFSVNVSTLKITDFNGRSANLIPSLLDIQATNGVIHVIDKVILPQLP